MFSHNPFVPAEFSKMDFVSEVEIVKWVVSSVELSSDFH